MAEEIEIQLTCKFSAKPSKPGLYKTKYISNSLTTVEPVFFPWLGASLWLRLFLSILTSSKFQTNGVLVKRKKNSAKFLSFSLGLLCRCSSFRLPRTSGFLIEMFVTCVVITSSTSLYEVLPNSEPFTFERVWACFFEQATKEKQCSAQTTPVPFATLFFRKKPFSMCHLFLGIHGNRKCLERCWIIN